MKHKIYLYVCLKNAVVMICWTVLAIIFGRWWIALFAALFMVSIKNQQGIRIRCDLCGVCGPTCEDADKARLMAQKSGWLCIIEDDTHKDYCPNCRAKYPIKFKF